MKKVLSVRGVREYTLLSTGAKALSPDWAFSLKSGLNILYGETYGDVSDAQSRIEAAAKQVAQARREMFDRGVLRNVKELDDTQVCVEHIELPHKASEIIERVDRLIKDWKRQSLFNSWRGFRGTLLIIVDDLEAHGVCGSEGSKTTGLTELAKALKDERVFVVVGVYGLTPLSIPGAKSLIVGEDLIWAASEPVITSLKRMIFNASVLRAQLDFPSAKENLVIIEMLARALVSTLAAGGARQSIWQAIDELVERVGTARRIEGVDNELVRELRDDVYQVREELFEFERGGYVMERGSE